MKRFKLHRKTEEPRQPGSRRVPLGEMSFAKVTALLFVLLLALGLLGSLFLPDKKFSADENRVLQASPSFSLSSYFEGRYETKVENYVNDQFPLRQAFIKLKTATDVTAGKLEANGVYRCSDHYLMEDLSTPDKHFVKTKNALRQFRRTYSKLNMYFLLAPNAANILEDKLPATVRVTDQNPAMTSFLDDMSSFGYKSIDVRKTLQKASKSQQVYYRTDHHWTSEGAYAAYKKAASAMDLDADISYEGYVVKNDFKGTLYSKSGFRNGLDDNIKIYMPTSNRNFKNSVIYYSDTKKKTTEFYQMENLKTKDAYTVFGGSNHPLYTIETPTESNRVLLVLKDSYANSFIPFLSQSFRKIVVVDPRYCYEDIDDIITSNDVSDVLMLYNANTFFTDTSLEMMLSD